MDSFGFYADSENGECPVCLEPLDSSFLVPGVKPNVVPECGHTLHEACFIAVYGLSQRHGSTSRTYGSGVCGVCRQPMKVSERNNGTPQTAATFPLLTKPHANTGERMIPVQSPLTFTGSISNNTRKVAPKFDDPWGPQPLQDLAVPEVLGETCQYPGCGKPVYKDRTSGKAYKHCGRTHARAAQTLSLQPLPKKTPFTFSNFSTALPQVDPLKKFGLVICDMQENYRQTVYQFPSVLATVICMIRLAEVFNIEIFVTTLWPLSYGACVPEILQQLSSTSKRNLQGYFYSKTGSFGSSQELVGHLKREKFSHVVICGVEAHIAIESQVRALATNELAVHVLVDGISSCSKEEVPLSLDRLRQLARTSDVSIWTTESIAFYLMETLGGRMEEGERNKTNFEFLGLINREHRGIASGLRNLLGNPGSSGFDEGSEAFD